MLSFTKKIVLILCLFFVVHTAFAAQSFIIDTDLAIDDAIAILYLSQRKDVDIKAITIAATGEAHCDIALKNLAGLLQLAKKTHIPIGCGPDQPLSGDHKFPSRWRAQADNLAGMAAFLPRAPAANELSAQEILFTTLKNAKEPVTILAIGPLTNLGNLLSQCPQLKNKIRMIYIMGGAIQVSGNVALEEPSHSNKTAEWNFYIDPKADDIVFRSGVPLTLIPLDTSNYVPIDKNFYALLNQTITNTEVAKFTKHLFTLNQQNFLNKKWYLWDPLAAVISTNESIATIKNIKMSIVLNTENKLGTTVEDKNGNWVRVCTKANPIQFNQVALQTLMSMPIS